MNLNGVTFDPTVSQTVRIFFELVRKTMTTERVSNGMFVATWHASTGLWDITGTGAYEGDNHGVVLTMSGNQVQYTSDNMTGASYVGTIRIKNFILA